MRMSHDVIGGFSEWPYPRKSNDRTSKPLEVRRSKTSECRLLCSPFEIVNLDNDSQKYLNHVQRKSMRF